ncbi:flagellar hook-basal body complex protein FliE [Cellulomonas soli]|uniref:flagellar hook-basal body complex protein FliE n=1 Tax=Cellulomonas soli TaxID=931535 RepID=UPI003F82A879
MSIAIPALAGVTGVAPTQYLQAASAADPVAAGTSGADFASVLSSVDGLQAAQSNAQNLAVQAVSGDLEDVHDYTVAASEASLALELTAAVRNKAVDAFTEIMRMQA